MFYWLDWFASISYHFIFRLAILRVHSRGLVTIDLQCYEEDNIAQLDNVSAFNQEIAQYFICYLQQVSKYRIPCDVIKFLARLMM